MLWIHKSVQQKIKSSFLSNTQEQGFLLGCTTRLDQLDHCCQIPAAQAGKFFYTPNSQIADVVIHNWAEQNICFCGFIHSHLVDKQVLSENDVDFAYRLANAYNLPAFWFGIGVANTDDLTFKFYSVTGKRKNISILPVSITFYD